MTSDGFRSLPAALAELDLGDWHDLLDAVKARLSRSVDGLAIGFEASPHDAFHADPPTSVLDCVSALDQLQHAVRLEFERLARRDPRGRADDHFTDPLRRTTGRAIDHTPDRADRTVRAPWPDLLDRPHLETHLQARLDQLLGLAGRADRLAVALARPASVSVMTLTLEGHRAVEARHGPEVGEALLRVVAERLARAVRAEDRLGRIGGDGFACLFEQLEDRERLGSVARKLAAAVAAPLQLGAIRVAVRPHIGIAIGPLDARSPRRLLGCAEAATQRAQLSGAPFAFYDRLADRPGRRRATVGG